MKDFRRMGGLSEMSDRSVSMGFNHLLMIKERYRFNCDSDIISVVVKMYSSSVTTLLSIHSLHYGSCFNYFPPIFLPFCMKAISCTAFRIT